MRHLHPTPRSGASAERRHLSLRSATLRLVATSRQSAAIFHPSLPNPNPRSSRREAQMTSASLAIIQQIEARRVPPVGQVFQPAGSPDFPVRGSDRATGKSPAPADKNVCPTLLRALVFTASVKAAEMTAEIFNRHRSGMASWLCGKTDREERELLGIGIGDERAVAEG